MSVNYNDTPWVLYTLDHTNSTFNKNYTRSCNGHETENIFRSDALEAAGAITGDFTMGNYRSSVQYKSSEPNNASSI